MAGEQTPIISKETATEIALAWREVETGEKLLVEVKEQPFEPFVDGRQAFDPEMDRSGGDCGEESCEADLFSAMGEAA